MTERDIRRARRLYTPVNWCAYCGRFSHHGWRSGPDDRFWHLDHIIPRSQGGPDLLWNLAKSCAACNIAKGVRRWNPIFRPNHNRLLGYIVDECEIDPDRTPLYEWANLDVEDLYYEIKRNHLYAQQ